MMTEDMIKIMLQSMLPLKFDIEVKLTSKDKEDLEFKLQGDVFISKMKGEEESRIFFSFKIPSRENEDYLI